MAYQTINNNRKNERIKNTITALNNELYSSHKLILFEKACKTLNEKIEDVHSFKALCRHPKVAKVFVDEFMNANPEQYQIILDTIKYSNNLCYGVDFGIYEKKMVDEFLGNIIFEGWWSAMIMIRHEEFSYYEEIDKQYRRKPDFGTPYRYLNRWIEDIAYEQNLQQVKFVLGRLNIGIIHRERFRELDKYYNEVRQILSK